MKIFYQWEPWAYSHIASNIAKDNLDMKIDEVSWLWNFSLVWEKIWLWNIWVLPVENSTAWSIHENLYNFLRHNFKIIGEISLEINHCLLSNEKDISNIKKVYSHPQALSQCYNFLKSHNIEPISNYDTAWSAKEIFENKSMWVWAIASNLAWEIYKLNVIKNSIQDQDWNTTRFFVIVPFDSKIDFKQKKGKVSIIFKTKNIPASLYKCLWAFATNHVNLTKIESMPSFQDPFTYMFWLDFEWSLNDENIKNSLEELKFFTHEIKILWEY